MARVTPALDRPTETARADFLRNITDPDMTGTGLPQAMTMGDMLAARTTAAAGTSSYLQLGSHVTKAIPRLYNIRRERQYETDEKTLERAVADPVLHGVGQEIAANVTTLVWDVDGYLIGCLSETVTQLPEPQVSALLLELWQIREEEFAPDAPGSDLDLNADDPLTATFDHPQHYLLDLIVDTVLARLMKRHGPELLLAWADAVDKAHR